MTKEPMMESNTGKPFHKNAFRRIERTHTETKPNGGTMSIIQRFIAASAVIAVLICSCAPVIVKSTGGSPDTGAATPETAGSLLLDISAIAPCIKNSNAPGAKAYLYATSVTVRIVSGSGENVISPVTRTLSLSNSGGSGTASLDPINSIPVGSGYVVYVDVYNSAYGTGRTVSGHKSGVAIAENAMTAINITCTPYSPSTITPNAGVSPSLNAYGEAWYSLNAAANQLYTIQPPSPSAYLFLYDSSGTFIADVSTAAYPLTAAAASVYYLGVASGASAVTPTVLVSATLPPANEGSIASPVSLALDADRTFLIGTTTNNDGASYYSFTANSAGKYFLYTSYYCNYYLYSDPSFSSLINSYTYSLGELSLGTLAASTPYYLKLTNVSALSNVSMTGRIISSDAISSMPVAQGSVSAPVVLTLGSSYAAAIGGHAWNNTSYYMFTTGSTPTISFVFGAFPTTLSGLYCCIGTDPTFASYSTLKYFNSSNTLQFLLAANTTYYLKIAPSNNSRFDTLATFSMTPSSYTPSYVALPLGTTASATAFTAGTITSTASETWYQVTLPNANGGSYSILWDDSSSGSGTYSLDVAVSAYQENNTAYFTGVDSAYNSPRMITVPAGQSSVRIRVGPWYSGYTGNFGIKFVSPSTGGVTVTIQ
jgi:hypothetical protein